MAKDLKIERFIDALEPIQAHLDGSDPANIEQLHEALRMLVNAMIDHERYQISLFDSEE
ncbi:MAG: hypothetical protein AAGL19_03405 [Pseudomonadota bacterium]